MSAAARRRAGLGAVVFGAGYFAGQAGELVFGSPSTLVDVVFALLGAIGFGSLLVAVWNLRLLGRSTWTRVGIWTVIVAAVVLTAFGVYLLVEIARTSEVPDQFLPFAIALLLLLLGQPLLALALRRSSVVGRAWPLPLVGVLGIVLSLTPIHDIGLFVLEGAWVALGVALLRGDDVRISE